MPRLLRTARPRYGGIDPGKQGYLCVYDPSSGEVVRSDPVPYLGKEVDPTGLALVFRAWKRLGVVFAVLEHQQPFGHEGAWSAFHLGAGYMALKAGLIYHEIACEVLAPDDWKQRIGVPVPGAKLPQLPRKPKTKDKAELRRWQAEKARVKTERDRIKRKRAKDRKALSCRKAQELIPGLDLRSSPRATKPHDGKAEAALMAVLAYRIQGLHGNEEAQEDNREDEDA